MRKLVKKLALVLALVLALGCIAPASAQAAEVRRSWNFAPDAWKPTLSLTVDDVKALEVLDYGDAVDLSMYDVAYYSSNQEALYVNKDTGYAEALAPAEHIKICAVVINKVTGGRDNVYAFVDIAAKPVETTPEATPTVEVTPEATPTEAPFALVDAEQYSKNQILLTFNKDANKDNVKKADLSVKYSLVEGSIARRGCYIKGDIDFNDDNTAIVTFWQDFKDDTFAYVSFQDSTPIEFPISVGQLSDIEIITTEVKPEDNGANILLRLIDENGVTLERVTLNNIPETDEYEIALTLDDEEDDEIAELNDDETGVIINEVGYAVFVEIFYTTEDAETEEEKDLYAAGQIVAADTTPVIDAGKWVVTNKTKSNEINYNSDIRLCMGDTDRRIRGLLTVRIPELDKDINDVVAVNKNTVNDAPFKSIVYETSDKNVVLVDANGVLVPVNQGSAEIIISYAPTYDEENEEWIPGDVIGVKEVTVEAARYLKKLTTDGAEKSSDAPVLSTKSTANDKVVIKVKGEDQYGETFKLTNSNGIKVVQSEKTSGKNYTDLVANGYVEVGTAHKDGYVPVTFVGYNGVESADKNDYRFEFRTGDDKLVTKTVYIKYSTSDKKADTYKLIADPSSTEVKTQGEKDLLDAAKKIEIVAWSYKGKIKLETVDIEGIYNPNVEKTTGNSFWFSVTVPSGENATDVAKAVTVTGSKLIFDPLTNRNENAADATWEAKSWTKGKYTFELWQYDKDGEDAESVASVTVEIKDGHKGTSTKVESTESAWDYKDVMEGTNRASGAGSFKTNSKVSASALFAAVLKQSAEDDEYCIILKDDTTEIYDQVYATGTSYEITEIEGYADGKNIVVITKITYEKTYTDASGQKTMKKLTSTVSEGSITFGVEEE